MKLLLRLLINGVALWAAAQLIPGIGFATEGAAGTEAIGTILIVSLIFGLINALIKPLVKFVTCPFYAATLGLFTLIVNALMLMLTAWVAEYVGQPFFVDGFVAAFLGGIVIAIVSTFLSIFVDD